MKPITQEIQANHLVRVFRDGLATLTSVMQNPHWLQWVEFTGFYRLPTRDIMECKMYFHVPRNVKLALYTGRRSRFFDEPIIDATSRFYLPIQVTGMQLKIWNTAQREDFIIHESRRICAVLQDLDSLYEEIA